MRIILFMSALLSCALPKDLDFPFEGCDGHDCEEAPASAPTTAPVFYAPNPPDKPCEERFQTMMMHDGLTKYFYDTDGDLRENITYNRTTPQWRELFTYNKSKQLISKETQPLDDKTLYTVRKEYTYNNLGLLSGETFSLFVAGCEKGPVTRILRSSYGDPPVEHVEVYDVCLTTKGYQHSVVYTYDIARRLTTEELFSDESPPQKFELATYSYKRRKETKSYDGSTRKQITHKNRAGLKTLEENWSRGEQQGATSFLYDGSGRLLSSEEIQFRKGKPSYIKEQRTYHYVCK